jgi:hypothetical protein
MPKTWFITGASRGFGRIWAEAALARGDRVAATARDESSLAELKARYGDAVLPLALDVTHAHQAKHAVERAHEHFSGLDVVINNAGYTLVGTVEEASAAERPASRPVQGAPGVLAHPGAPRRAAADGPEAGAPARQPITPVRLALQRPDPGGDLHRVYFNCPVRYGAPANSVVLRSSDLDRPFPGHTCAKSTASWPRSTSPICSSPP